MLLLLCVVLLVLVSVDVAVVWIFGVVHVVCWLLLQFGVSLLMWWLLLMMSLLFLLLCLQL